MLFNVLYKQQIEELKGNNELCDSPILCLIIYVFLCYRSEYSMVRFPL